jgi:hypothetical protein
MRKLVTLLAMVVFTLAASPSWSEIPHRMNYSGMLTDDAGNPLNGTYDLTFAIYDVGAGGTALWIETHYEVLVEDGLVSLVLGSSTAIPSYVFAESVRYLGIQVGSDSELTPRIRLTSVGYAYRSEFADTAIYAVEAVTAQSDNDWVIAGQNLYRLTGNLGLGTTAPDYPITVKGTEEFDVNQKYLKFVNRDGSDRLRVGYNEEAHGFIEFYDGSSDELKVQLSTGGHSFLNGGNLGIGTDSPTVKLDVVGTVQMTGFKMPTGASNGYVLTSDGSGAGTWQAAPGGGGGWADDGNAVRLETGTDSVGIGTAAPSEKLDVAGTARVTGFKMSTGAASGKILTSDADGLGTWQAAPAGGWTDDGSAVRLETGTDSVGIGTAAPSEKLDVAGTAQVTGFKMPTGASSGHVLTSDGSGVGSWQAPSAGGSNWTPADSVLYTNSFWGIARGSAGDTLYGDNVHTMINLGVACTTGAAGLNYSYCSVGGGLGNLASQTYATVGGGTANRADNAYATVAGGDRNAAGGNRAFVGGGQQNTASHFFSTVGGGRENTAGNNEASVGGGYLNAASGIRSTIAGGALSTAGGNHAAVGGGMSNTASGDYATIPGGNTNTAAGDYSFAAGSQVNVTSDADSTFAFGYNFTTSTPNAVIFHNSASDIKVGIQTTSPQRALHIKDVLRLEPRSAAPGSPSEGDIYVNSTDHHIYCYLNGQWRQLDPNS